jgi:hypothetical protein
VHSFFSIHTPTKRPRTSCSRARASCCVRAAHAHILVCRLRLLSATAAAPCYHYHRYRISASLQLCTVHCASSVKLSPPSLPTYGALFVSASTSTCHVYLYLSCTPLHEHHMSHDMICQARGLASAPRLTYAFILISLYPISLKMRWPTCQAAQGCCISTDDSTDAQISVPCELMPSSV